MPELSGFKQRRKDLRLSFRQIEKSTGITLSTIWRIEHGKGARYDSVRTLHEFYLDNEKLK